MEVAFGLEHSGGGPAPLLVHLNQALESLDQTSRSVGELTDYLQRNPSALIRGRYVENKGK